MKEIYNYFANACSEGIHKFEQGEQIWRTGEQWNTEEGGVYVFENANGEKQMLVASDFYKELKEGEEE